MPEKDFDFFLKVTDEDVRMIKIKYSNDHKNVWDPVDKFNIKKITSNSAVTLAKYEKLKKNPDIPRKQRNKGLIISTILIICTFPANYLFGNGYVTLVFLILGVGIYSMITDYYKKLCIDLIKISIALEKNWFYDPQPESVKWSFLVKKFPEIFNRGNAGQNVEDQFWGRYPCNNAEYDFYSGIFNYVRVTKDSKGKTHSRDYVRNFFCIKLLKPLKTRFFLFTHGTGVKPSEIKSMPIITESIEFNKYFNISYDTQNEKVLEIVKTLSPAVQVRLTDMIHAKGAYGILFSENCVFYVFNRLFLHHLKSNLYKGIELNPQDKIQFEAQFSNLINLTIDMIKYMD